jgi:hypothetical protein
MKVGSNRQRQETVVVVSHPRKGVEAKCAPLAARLLDLLQNNLQSIIAHLELVIEEIKDQSQILRPKSNTYVKMPT